jgi:hypothetical protein
MTAVVPFSRVRRLLAPAGLAAALALAGGPAAAAGPALADFVPAGFRIEKRITTDIGGDAHRDAVLVLVRRAPANAPPGDPPPLARRLVILKARSDGGFVQIGEGRRVLLCTRCGGAFFGVARTPVTVKVRRKIVIAEQESGSRVITFQRFRFRSEGALSVRLIGVDVRATDRLTGIVVETSTNRLTGERIVTRTDAKGRRTVRSSRVPVKPVFIEAVRYTDPG